MSLESTREKANSLENSHHSGLETASQESKRDTASNTYDVSSDLFIEKSFGVLREELLTAQNTNYWLNGIYYFSIFLGMFVAIMESNVVSVMTSYATSEYKQHSLMSTVGVIRSVVVAASLPLYARASDNFGRLELFLFSLVFRVVGLIIMSQATDINKYAGGIVLYGFGFAGSRIMWQFNLADTSSLRWRFMTAAVLHLPNIIITWSSGDIVSSLLSKHGWSFGIALWAYVFPLACVPYLLCSLRMRWMASKTEAWKQLKIEERRSYIGMNESTLRHEELGGVSSKIKVFFIRFGYIARAVFWKVDLIGCLFVVVIWGLILVPLTLAGGQHSKWKQGSIIAPLVLGFVIIPFFILWELRGARFPLVPVPLLKDRGIWAACLIGILYTFVTGMPSTYAYPVLLVGMNATETVATRIPQLEGFVTALTIPFFGLVLAYYRRSKAFILLGVVAFFIAMGLFVHFRGDNDGVEGQYYRNGVAVGMCVTGFGVAFIARLVVVSAQACTNHEYTALIIALFASLYSIGAAIGKSVSGAIWTQRMYPTIVDNMKKLDVDTSLAQLAYQKPYLFIQKAPWGSPARIAVALAYADIQKKLCIVAVCLCVPTLIVTFFLRDHYLVSKQSLDDERKEHGEKSQILFKNDDDAILNFLKKCVGRK